jgi:GNAT superfamily N-acetyltransferase
MRPINIRPLEAQDPPIMAAAFAGIGWHKPEAQYHGYLDEQAAGSRSVFVAHEGKRFAGYVTVRWRSNYPYFRDQGIPEISDLNVLPEFRRRGVATQLVDAAEAAAARVSAIVGIGVGLHPGYNAAQRMYVLRGYVPDGNGVTYDNRFVSEGETVAFDDRLVLHLTRSLPSGAT